MRELENLLHRAVALSGGETIDVADLGLPESRGRRAALATRTARRHAARRACGAVRRPRPALPLEAAAAHDLEAYLDEVERDILVRALERHRFNRTAAGASLGLSLRQMRYRMARLGVNVGGDGVGAERD